MFCIRCCELLSNSLSLTNWKQHVKDFPLFELVVNCFQILYLWQTENSAVTISMANAFVVNCFQILYLWQTENSILPEGRWNEMLWIAFKFFIFDKLKTAVIFFTFKDRSCELLSNSLSLTNWKQQAHYLKLLRYVVNCFQILYLWQTENSLISNKAFDIVVVNCFQILYLWQTENSRVCLLWWFSVFYILFSE